MRLLRWRRRLRGELGTTVIELVVVTTILGIVLPTAYGAVISMQKEEHTTTDRFAAEGEAQTIMDRLTRDIRAGVRPSSSSAAFLSADDKDVTFFASLDPTLYPTGPIRLHAYVSPLAGSSPTIYLFHEDLTLADSGSAPNYTYTGSVQPRFDGRYVDAVNPIFVYYDKYNTKLTTPIASPGVRASIESVAINLAVHIAPTSPVVKIQTRVHVRNVDYVPS